MLLALVALFFAIGHGHQIFERFEVHDHAGAVHHHDHNDAEHSDHDAPADSDDHAMWHHAVVAVIELGHEPLAKRLEMLSVVENVVVFPPDGPVLGIELPPQIVLG